MLLFGYFGDIFKYRNGSLLLSSPKHQAGTQTFFASEQQDEEKVICLWLLMAINKDSVTKM